MRKGRISIDLAKQTTIEILNDNGGKEGMSSNYAANYAKFDKIVRNTTSSAAVEERRRKYSLQVDKSKQSLYMERCREADNFRTQMKLQLEAAREAER